MKFSKHTPGPWRVAGWGRYRRAIFAATQQSPVAATLSDPRGSSVNDANARLIALAPELAEYAQWAASSGCLTAKALITKLSR